MKTDRRTLALETRRIGIGLELLTDRAMETAGLSAAQAHMLLFILKHSNEGVSLTDIHHESGCSMASLSSVLKRLRENGYVRAEPCVDDDRRKLLFSTKKGESLEAFLNNAICDACDRVYRNFSETELMELDRLQKKLINNLSENKEYQARTRKEV